MNWRNRLAPRDRRAIRIGLWIGIPILFLLGVGRPYLRALHGLRGRVFAQRQLVARERALISDAARYPAVLSTIQIAADQEARRLFDGEPMEASGALVQYLAERADRSRVLLEATEGKGVERAGAGLVALVVQVRAVSDLTGILRFLQSLEGGTRLVRVEDLVLERHEGPYSASAYGATGSGDVQVVTMTATLRAFAVGQMPEDGEQ